MNTWRNVTINDLGQVITGSTPPTKKTEYYGNEYPFITPTDIEIDSRINSYRTIFVTGRI